MLLPLLALLFAACDPSEDSNDIKAPNYTADAISQALQITQEQDEDDKLNTNRITFTTGGAYYIHLKDQAGTILATGRSGKATLPYYGSDNTKVTVEAINPDGSLVSFTRDVKVAKWVDVPTFLDLIFGPDLTKKVTTTWVWDGDTYGGNVFGNGGWMNNTAPGWWCVSKTDIDDQCAQKQLPLDNFEKGWMKFTYDPAEGYTVTTSRGESGKLSFTIDQARDGWDVGTMIFSGTIPLFGIQVNFDNQRQQKYQILKAGSDGTHLMLCAPEPGITEKDGTAWFWAFKRVSIE